MRRIAIIETVWYLAFQDGPADNERYKTEAEAKKALRAMKGEKRGVCIMSRTREVDPVNTPGPWIAIGSAPYDGCDCWWVQSEPNPGRPTREIATVNGPQRDPEWEANAKLIAAAPDLLEALKGVVAIADRKTDEFDKARAAIAKAQGQS